MGKMSPTDPTPATAYRLCGEIEEVFRSFYLGGPVVRVGSHPGHDVVLPFSGVSRDHAVLTASAGGLIVEDRGSKNGTLLNGDRVARARAVAGDELTLGSVSLVVEAVDAADAKLALVFGDAGDEPVPEAGEIRETDLLESRPVVSAAAHLRWIEAFVTERASPGNPLAAALEGLRSRVGSAALGAVVLRRREPPTILGAAGEVEAMSRGLDHHAAALASALLRSRAGGWQLEIFGAADMVVGLSPIADDEALAVVALGEFPGRSTCGPLLRLICRLIEISEGVGERDLTSPPPPREHRLAFPDGYVTGRSAATRGLYRELEMVCGGDYPVLILGETGSGKELVAATLHRSSARARQPLVAVNCAAIPADLLEAEMFGVVRGAATGVAPRPGCFARARGGTLFLDEIGEMPPELQAKLLRVLDSGEMQPVGGTPVAVDVRVLSATNVDVEECVAKGTLRADLYYRLAASEITVPPLRARREDLPALIQHFVQIFAEELGLRLRGMSQRALQLLMAYPWPGNVRELQHELRRVVQQALPGQTIDSSLLPEKIRLPSSSRVAAVASPATAASVAGGSARGPARSLDLRERVAEVEREVILEALAETGGRRRPAAKLLGISRNTLAAKITQHGLA